MFLLGLYHIFVLLFKALLFCTSNFLPIFFSIINLIIAFLLFFIAYKTWQYNRELTKANIVLYDHRVEKDKKKKGRTELIFFFKNTGREMALILKAQAWIVQLATGDNLELKSDAIFFPIGAEGIYRYIVGHTLLPGIGEEDFEKMLGGRIAIILIVTFKGKSRFSKKQTTMPFLLSYKPPDSILPLNHSEYEVLKKIYPETCKKIENLI